MARKPGRHFLNIPGPTPVPDRVLRAMDHPTIDHRGPDFGKMTLRILEGLRPVFGVARDPIIIYPSSGTGAWVAALVNTLSPGDKVLMVETGQFATLWKKMADGLGLQTEFMPTDWRRGADETAIEARLRDDKAHEIKAVCVVHNETSTGCTSPIAAIRKAIDAAGHPALYMVDTISSLASMPYKQDEWQVDVTVGGSQKGLMLPPGLSFTGVSQKALKATETARLPKVYWDWKEIIATNERGYFPYTPATNLLYGLEEALKMLMEEGLDTVFARHDRHAEATRRAVQAWGLETLCANPRDYSNTVTAVLTPAGHNADTVRELILKNFDMSLGVGLSKVAGKVFRIGHLGDTNDLTILGALSGVEMGLRLAGVPHQRGGAQAAVDYLAGVAGDAGASRVAAQ
ncbi:MAG: aminotransferase class V-fold PLP-dependent enzyme [Hyphomicrobiales bacterium]|nr:aminotransferase class V-fold PLP-dependent enzyme [Hyphomicrobiales bacterium]